MRRFKITQQCFCLKKKNFFSIKKYGKLGNYLYRSFFGEIKLSDFFIIKTILVDKFNMLMHKSIQPSLCNLQINDIMVASVYWNFLLKKKFPSTRYKFSRILLITKTKCDYKLVLRFLQNLYIGLNTGWHFDILFLNINYKILLYKQYGQTFLHFFTGQSHAIILRCSKSIFCVTKKRKKMLRIFSYNLFNITTLAKLVKNLRPVSKYKNKGIRYAGELLSFKEGKAKQR